MLVPRKGCVTALSIACVDGITVEHRRSIGPIAGARDR